MGVTSPRRERLRERTVVRRRRESIAPDIALQVIDDLTDEGDPRIETAVAAFCLIARGSGWDEARIDAALAKRGHRG
jgi:hypothetical protein